MRRLPKKTPGFSESDGHLDQLVAPDLRRGPISAFRRTSILARTRANL